MGIYQIKNLGLVTLAAEGVVENLSEKIENYKENNRYNINLSQLDSNGGLRVLNGWLSSHDFFSINLFSSDSTTSIICHYTLENKDRDSYPIFRDFCGNIRFKTKEPSIELKENAKESRKMLERLWGDTREMQYATRIMVLEAYLKKINSLQNSH